MTNQYNDHPKRMAKRENNECELCGLTVPHCHPTGIAKEIILTDEEEDQREWATYDMGLSCALICLGYTTKRIIDDPQGRANKRQFIFDDSREMREDTERYWSGNLKVDAQTYFNEIKSMKNRLYSR